MLKKKIVIVFEDGLDANQYEKRDEVRRFNPALWDGRVMNRATHIYAPSHPKIESLYEKAGKKVLGRKREAIVVAEDESEDSFGEEAPIQQETNADFRTLTWPKQRSLATKFTDEPVKSKEDAIAILEKAEADGKL